MKAANRRRTLRKERDAAGGNGQVKMEAKSGEDDGAQGRNSRGKALMCCLQKRELGAPV